MPKRSSTVKANNYVYVSYRCKDGRLRYATGVKYTDSLSKSDFKYIEKVKQLVDNYAMKHELMEEDVFKADLVAYLDRELDSSKTGKKATRDLEADHNDMIKKMQNGRLLKKRSKKKYSELSIDQFISMKKVWVDCSQDPLSGFSLSYDITIEEIHKLIVWLTSQQYSQNSIYNVVNNLKIFLKYTYDEGYHNNDVFKHKDFSVPTEESDAIAPTYDEILMIYNAKVKKSLEKGRDLFVYGCFLALRVKDLGRINEYKLVGNVYEILTNKTGKKVVIPCHWLAREIYDKYAGVLPTINRFTFYKQIPKICKAAGIAGEKLITMTIGGQKTGKYYKRWELMTPHSMRRFFATWMYRELRRQPREIMPITGHDTEESFFKYIKIEMEMNAHEIANDPAFKKPL